MNTTGTNVYELGYNPTLIGLSVMIAIFAVFASLDFGRRSRITRGRQGAFLVAAAAATLGGGIWAMGLVGMLAMRAPICIGCNVSSTLGPLAIAMASAAIGFLVTYLRPGRLIPMAAAGILMGVGISGMHYVDMLAVPAFIEVDYAPALIGASILLSIITCSAVLYLLRFQHRFRLRLIMAGVLGVALGGMQYVGTSAVLLRPEIPISTIDTANADHAHLHALSPEALEAGIVGHKVSRRTALETARHTESEHFNVAILVAMGVFVVLCLSLLASAYDRRLSAMLDMEARLLREGEERARQRYRMTPAPLHSVDAQDGLIEVSNAWLDLLGYTRSEVIGRPLSDFMEPASARHRREVGWPTLLAEGSERYTEYRFLRKTGQPVDALLSATVEHHPDGTVLSTVEALLDVTARRRAEEMLRQSQKLEAVGQLTGGIAHDFNNLLTVIVGSIEMAEHAGGGNPRLLRSLSTMRDAAERGASLTQHLLAFSRRQPLRPERVDTKEVIGQAVALLTKTLRQDVVLRLGVPDSIPAIRIDPGNLKIALLNVGINAQDAMPKGGMLDITAEYIPDGTQHDLPGPLVAIHVSDTGEGIAPDVLSKVMEPFFTTKDVGKGSGLGLSQAYGFARQSRGLLRISSTVGEGTRVTFLLPVAGNQGAPPLVDEDVPLSGEARFTHTAPSDTQDGLDRSRSEPDTRPGNGSGLLGDRVLSASEPPCMSVQGPCSGRILLVEDDASVAEMATIILREAGYDVVAEMSAPAAQARLLQDTAFDLIFSDLVMPGGMSGLDLAKWARSTYPTIPILLTTGYTAHSNDDALQTFSVLFKPYRQAKLLSMVAEAMGSMCCTP